MDSVTIAQLSKPLAKAHATSLVALIRAMAERQYWEAEHLLDDRRMKWEFSVMALHQNENHPVGLLIASQKDDNTAHIHKQAVDPHYRGQSIGKQLFAAFYQRVQQHSPSIERITLHIYSDNVRGIKFNEQNGFEAVAERDTPLGRSLLMQHAIS